MKFDEIDENWRFLTLFEDLSPSRDYKTMKIDHFWHHFWTTQLEQTLFLPLKIDEIPELGMDKAQTDLQNHENHQNTAWLT